MSPLPRVSCQATSPAPSVTVRGYNGKAARVVAKFNWSWNEFLDNVTDVLDQSHAVSKLYDHLDNEIHSADQLSDTQIVYTARQADLKAADTRVGIARQKYLKDLKQGGGDSISASPPRLMSPLVSDARYAELCTAAEKRARRPKPLKIIVRANHWDTHDPPSRYAAIMLVTGSLETLKEDVTKRLGLSNSLQTLFHADDRIVEGLEDIVNGETLYIVRKNVVDSGRHWAKTLCPLKRKVVTVHLNHWADAPPPSRYQQFVLVPENLELMYLKTTLKCKTNGPVVRLFQKNGRLITSVDEIEDEGHIYLTQAPDKLKLSAREWGKTLCPPKKCTICIHGNRDTKDPGSYMPIIAKSKDMTTQMGIVLEEITRRLKLGMMLRRVYDADGEAVQSVGDMADGGHYYSVPIEPVTPVKE